MWFKSSPAWAPCEQRKHFLISDSKTHKHSNTQRATQVIKMVWNSFTLWNVNFLIIEICFLNISFSPLLMSCIRLSRLAISVVVFFVSNRVFQSCIDSSMNLIDFFFDNLPKIQFFGTKLRQIWFQVYASTVQVHAANTNHIHVTLLFGRWKFEFRNQLVFYRPKRRQVN